VAVLKYHAMKKHDGVETRLHPPTNLPLGKDPSISVGEGVEWLLADNYHVIINDVKLWNMFGLSARYPHT
jgi:hypothetical protein